MMNENDMTHMPHGDEPISDNWFDYEDDLDEGATVVSRHVAWHCEHCGEQNFTDLPFEYTACAECGTRYSQYDVASDDLSYEETLYSNGDVDHDPFIPDYPDFDDEPEPPEDDCDEPPCDEIQYCSGCGATTISGYCEICRRGG